MPTITFATDDLYKLVGQKLDDKKLVQLLDCAKAELDAKLTTEATIKFNDTNQPYLWSVEGLARLFRNLLGKTSPKIKIEKPKEEVYYDKRLAKIRPYIACFTATGKKIDDYLLKQLIQLQEKLAENYGRKRQKISIGVYPLKNITFPISYRAASPDETFTPLDFHQQMSLKQVLEKHPKGKEYGHLIKNQNSYPVFSDARKNILSLIPIINSEQTGKMTIGDDSLLFDTTGTDEESVNLVANIFAYALAERGFTIHALNIRYPNKKVATPTMTGKKMKFDEKEIEKLLGIKLKPNEIKTALERMEYEYQNGNVTIPCYRDDIMHQVDIIEDVAIAYGYDKFTALPQTAYTIGSTFPIQQFIDTQREQWIGLGYQEIMSPALSNKEILYNKMNLTDTGTIEIENPVSLTYSCIRTWILPILLDFLSKNKHVDYPQKIFEQGLVTKRETEAIDEQHLAGVTAHTTATFTEIRQAAEAALRSSNITYTFEELDLECFVPGRAAKIMVNGKQAGFIGEFHPAVLEKFGITTPVAGCEINLTALRS